MDQLEREEQCLEDDLAAGNITLAEFNREMRELHRSYFAEAEESAQRAYHNEMDRW
jgi:hypothetical protein